MRARTGTFGVVAIFAVIGCGEAPRRITTDDITPIPPGTAIGSLYSGDYIATSGVIEACHCRVGSCATLHISVGSVASVHQTDGTLQIIAAAGGGCSGGVNSDGTFSCDGEVVQPGNVQFVVATGLFRLANGQPMWLDMTQELTLALPSYDCDTRSSLTAQYTGPPTALVAPAMIVTAPADREPPFGLAGIAVGP